MSCKDIGDLEALIFGKDEQVPSFNLDEWIKTEFTYSDDHFHPQPPSLPPQQQPLYKSQATLPTLIPSEPIQSPVVGNTPLLTEADPQSLDRRRRNTLASARFRIKKKQREQEMERVISELRVKVAELGDRVVELERENGVLRGLVLDKRE